MPIRSPQMILHGGLAAVVPGLEARRRKLEAAFRRACQPVPNRTHAEAVSRQLGICSGHGLQAGVLTLDRGFSTAVISRLKEAGIGRLMPRPST